MFLVSTALILVSLILLVIFASIGSLRESIYDDIFWQIGANTQRLELFRRKTLYKATLKISLFLNLLFINTLLFDCLGVWVPSDPSTQTMYWSSLVVYSLLLVANQIHGHSIAIQQNTKKR